MPQDLDLLCFSAMAGVFPGSDSIDQLWQGIVQARCAPLTDLPSRWGIDRARIFSPEVGRLNHTYLDRAFCLPSSLGSGQGSPWHFQSQLSCRMLKGLLADADRQSAQAIDRQSLALVLGTSWSDESYFMADAQLARGESPPLSWHDPASQLQAMADAAEIGGPQVSVDTACSSFAYALATAEALISSGQARRAVVAGVNAFLPPTLFLGFSQLRALAPDARLKAFGEDAQGIVPGECVAAFLIEPLGEALSAGRQPLGLLRSLGISSDGAEGSVFAPGHQAQMLAYQRAYAEVDPASIHYIEAHGTGTPVGDGTELQSLHDFFQPHLKDKRKLPVGSIKTLIGHTLAAAGAASLAKVLLMLRHRVVPPHVDQTPHHKLAELCFELRATAQALPAQSSPLRLGLSSFGFGGANAHAVIEEARALSVPVSVPVRRSVVQLGLSVVGVEAALARCASAQALQQHLRASPPAPAATPFPASRLGTAVLGTPPQGFFLQGQYTIDVKGYRMGPRPLSHIDPYKLLLTHRMRVLLNRLPGMAASPDTAVVMCANMGGEHFFKAYRHIAEHVQHKASSAPDLIVDDVATMLPTMLSGYPAQILDLRGFHQTVSGRDDCFWSVLRSTPQWLAGRCRNLVLGAGHYLSSPADAVQAQRRGVTWGEGFGVLALKSDQAAAEDEDVVLAHLRCIVDASQAATPEEARQLAGLPAKTHDVQLEVCELAPDAGSGAEAVLGQAQTAMGFLGEATGIEAILAIILGPHRHGVIEVRRAGAPLFWLFLNKAQETLMPADPAPTLPMGLTFSRTPEITAEVKPEAVVMPVLSLAPQVAQAHDAQGDSLGDHPDRLARLLTRSLDLRLRMTELLCQRPPQDTPSLADRLRSLRRSARNLVLAEAWRDSGQLHARVLVDEAHPYFFDHPLDHVPGILLLESALQLAELHLAEQAGPAETVTALDVRFQRYTEKHKPITASLSTPSDHACVATLFQEGKVVCEVRMSTSHTAPRPVADIANHLTIRPEKRYLHKVRDENVLVHDLQLRGDQLGVTTCAIEADHCFSDGAPDAVSLLYFLEIARQCFMLIAHTQLDVPLGTPMNLVELRFEVTAPIPRHGTFWLVPKFNPEPWKGHTRTSRTSMTLHDAHGAFGQASIVSQAIAPEVYALQRHAATS
ncbi:MAG: polyketide synthase [Rubrivivax sp.]|nr:MAG: polyketide synthase [Rubrivivax sp.]